MGALRARSRRRARPWLPRPVRSSSTAGRSPRPSTSRRRVARRRARWTCSGQNIPYLVSRPDPWDKASPHHRWGPVLLGARTVQSKLGVDGPRGRRLRSVDAVEPAARTGREDDDGIGEHSGLGRADVARAPFDLDLGRCAQARSRLRRHGHLRRGGATGRDLAWCWGHRGSGRRPTGRRGRAQVP